MLLCWRVALFKVNNGIMYITWSRDCIVPFNNFLRCYFGPYVSYFFRDVRGLSLISLHSLPLRCYVEFTQQVLLAHFVPIFFLPSSSFPFQYFSGTISEVNWDHSTSFLSDSPRQISILIPPPPCPFPTHNHL